MIRTIGTLGFALAVLAAGAAHAEDQAREVRPAELPEAVLKAVEARAPGSKFQKAYRGIEDGQACCLLIGKDARGRELTVEATERGTILLLQTTIPMAEVPAKIRLVIERDHKDKVFARISTREGRGDAPGTTRYDFECAGLTPRGERLVLTFLEQGPRR